MNGDGSGVVTEGMGAIAYAPEQTGAGFAGAMHRLAVNVGQLGAS